MVRPARAVLADPSAAPEPITGRLWILAVAANDNNALGDLTSTTEGAAAVGSNPALNLTTNFTPDAVGDVTAVVDPRGNATTTQYDANGNLINLAYDGFNRLARITHPDSTTELSQYDPDGDLVIWTNRGGFGIVRCYDVLNRKISETGTTGAALSGACATGGTSNLATRSWDIQPRTFGYDLAGRLTLASIPSFPLSYSYDAAGRPTARGASWSAGYGWDAAGNLTALTYPDGSVVDYQYDALNRTTKALNGSTSYGSQTWDALGRRNVLTFHDTSTQTWGYDGADRVTSIAHAFPNDAPDNVTLTYTYDNAGREIARTTSNAAYAYIPSLATTAYAAANALNQYPTVASYPYTWWPEGGLKQSAALQANYDEQGKLMLAYITATPGVIDPNDFEYMALDGLGHLYAHARQTTAGQSFPFIYHSTDGLRPETILEWQCHQMLNVPPTCTNIRRYVLGPDPDERWAFIDGPTIATSVVDSPHTDREGTIVALSNGGIVSQKYTYDAYGQSSAPLSEVGPGSNTYAYRFTGQRLDPNTGLYDYKARDYSTGLGRFLQPDPAGLDKGPNLYEYVGSSPANHGDPTGMDGCDAAASSIAPVSCSYGEGHGAGARQSSFKSGEIGASAGISVTQTAAATSSGSELHSDCPSCDSPQLTSVANYGSGIGPNYKGPTFGLAPTWGTPIPGIYPFGRINSGMYGGMDVALSAFDALAAMNRAIPLSNLNSDVVTGNGVPGWSTYATPTGYIVNEFLPTGLAIRSRGRDIRIDIPSGTMIRPGVYYQGGVPEVVHFNKVN